MKRYYKRHRSWSPVRTGKRVIQALWGKLSTALQGCTLEEGSIPFSEVRLRPLTEFLPQRPKRILFVRSIHSILGVRENIAGPDIPMV